MAAIEVSPELRDVGIAIGLLSVPNGNPDAATFNDDFFARPDHYLSGVLQAPAQRDAVLRTASRTVDPDGTPIPGEDGEQWVPLVTTSGAGTAVTSGLFLVTRPVGDDLLLSLGAQVERTDEATLRVAARIPLFLVGSAGAAFAVGTDVGTMRIDASAVLPAGGPLGIERVVAGVTLPTTGTAPPTFVVRVQRPPEGDPGDIVFDSTSPLGPQAVHVLTQLLSAIAAQAGAGLGATVQDLLALIGLGDDPPIPPLPVEEMVSIGRRALWDWLRAVMSVAPARDAWVDRLAHLAGVARTGAGTAADPYAFCVTAGAAEVCLRLACTTDNGALELVPSLSIGVTAPGAVGVPARGDVVADLVRLRLDADPSATLAPHFSALVTVGTVTGTTSLVSAALPGAGTVSVGALRTGLTAGGAGLAYVLEAHRVTFPGVPTMARLDLTDTDAVLDAGGAVLDAAIGDLLTALGDTPAAQALFALSGLRRPTGTTAATWPFEVTIAELFTDPVAAIRGYHVEVLQAGRWGTLAQELGSVFQVGTGLGTTVSGDGTVLVPWSFPLFSDVVGAAELVAWTTDDADGLRVHLGGELALPAVTISAGKTVGIAVDVELLSVRIAGPGGAAADVDPRPLPELGIELRLGDQLDLDVGPLVVGADRIEAGVRWSGASGLYPHLAAVQPTVAVDGVRQPLPLPTWDHDQRRFVFAGDIPWAVLERLAAQLLESLASAAAQMLTGVLGWQTDRAGHLPAVPPAPGAPAVPGSTPTLEELVADPLRAIGKLLAGVLASPQARQWAESVLGFVGTAAQGLTEDVPVTGTGSDEDPWAVPLTPSGRQIELVASSGAQPAAPGAIAGRLLPAELRDVLDADDPSAVTVDVLVAGLDLLSRFDPHVRQATDRAVAPSTSLAALRSAMLGTDGLVASAGQHGIGTPALTLTGIGHLDLPVEFAPAHLPAGTPGATGRIFVRIAVRGVAPWPDETAERTVDLDRGGPHRRRVRPHPVRGRGSVVRGVAVARWHRRRECSRRARRAGGATAPPRRHRS